MTDKQWTVAILRRDRERCRVGLAGCRGRACEAHHIFSRSHKAMRHLLLNGISVCRPCHSWLESHPAKALTLIERFILGGEQYGALIEVYRERYGYFPFAKADSAK